MEISADDVDDLARGCDLLGSGGGGSTAAAELILAHHLGQGPAVELRDEVDDDVFVACVGAVGSAAVMLESLPSPLPFVRAVEYLGRHEQRVQAVLPLEVGGVNGVLAVLAAAALGVDLVDADPMGRAFTRLDRTVLEHTVPLRSLAFCGSSGELAYFEASHGPRIEQMVRSILPTVGGWGVAACYAGHAGPILRGAVRGAISRALSLGRALSAAIHGNPELLLARRDVAVVFEGSLDQVTRRPGVEAGGTASLRHRSHRRFARLDFSNEYAVLIDGGELTASAPDIICVLDENSWQPVSPDELEERQRVRVLTIAAPPELRAAHERSEAFGLASHGLHEVGRRS